MLWPAAGPWDWKMLTPSAWSRFLRRVAVNYSASAIPVSAVAAPSSSRSTTCLLGTTKVCPARTGSTSRNEHDVESR